jgi:hypothetical protein
MSIENYILPEELLGRSSRKKMGRGCNKTAPSVPSRFVFREWLLPMHPPKVTEVLEEREGRKERRFGRNVTRVSGPGSNQKARRMSSNSPPLRAGMGIGISTSMGTSGR